MPRLIHLNGMPAVGKSTLADLYVRDHPGVLNLDIDRLQELVGGWEDLRQPTHGILRPVALAMASAHLQGGHDVVLPYFLGGLSEIQEFERVAERTGSRFCQIVLLDSKSSSLARFERRTGTDPWNLHVRRCVEHWGGVPYLEGLYSQLLDRIHTTAGTVVLPSIEGALDETYALLVSTLEDQFPSDVSDGRGTTDGTTRYYG
ncbi:AAA family ATPase [Nocardia asiatica]|uniref:AAA family ATPase n=1 Tax=Nocardia asiatica TaxID=209252 RepID=UPI003EDF105B